MQNKTIKDYVYNGCGFPVIIDEVEIAEFGGDRVPLIDYPKLEAKVFGCLIRKGTRLTGKELKFIRLSLDETTDTFGKALGQSHVAVVKWEKSGDESPNMMWTTEIVIRMRAAQHLNINPDVINELLQRLIFSKPENSAAAQPIRISGVSLRVSHPWQTAGSLSSQVTMSTVAQSVYGLTEMQDTDFTHDTNVLTGETRVDQLANAA